MEKGRPLSPEELEKNDFAIIDVEKEIKEQVKYIHINRKMSSMMKKLLKENGYIRKNKRSLTTHQKDEMFQRIVNLDINVEERQKTLKELKKRLILLKKNELNKETKCKERSKRKRFRINKT